MQLLVVGIVVTMVLGAHCQQPPHSGGLWWPSGEEVVCEEAGDGAPPVLSPHPQDCSRYYECVGTAPVLRQCEAGLYWDAREGACTWPEVSGCSMQFIKVSLVTCTMYVLS